MTQLHFTLNIEDIQNLINTEVKNDMAKMSDSFLKKYPIKST